MFLRYKDKTKQKHRTIDRHTVQWVVKAFSFWVIKLKNIYMCGDTLPNRKKRLLSRSDEKYWVSYRLKVISRKRFIFFPFRRPTSWCSLKNPKSPSLQPPAPLTVFRGFSFYGASMSDLEVTMIGLVFFGFANIDIWPLPAGLCRPDSWDSISLPTPLCEATNWFSTLFNQLCLLRARPQLPQK